MSPQKSRQQQHAAEEAAHVRPPGNPSSLTLAADERERSAEELHHKPEAEKDERRQFHGIEEDKERDHRQDAGAGAKQEVGPHDSRDGAARPNRGEGRTGIGEEMDEGRHHS